MYAAWHLAVLAPKILRFSRKAYGELWGSGSSSVLRI
jgi:hypothetical protein